MPTRAWLLIAAAVILLSGPTAYGQYGGDQDRNNGGQGGNGNDQTRGNPGPSGDNQGGGNQGGDNQGGGNQGGDNQNEPGQGSGPRGRRRGRFDRGGPNQGGGERNEGEGSRDQAQSDAAAPTLNDAAENFQTLVEAYLARNGTNGAWIYKEKGATERLKLVSVNKASIHDLGDSRYAGTATMRDARTKRRRSFIFTADFSGTDWKIVSARPASRAR